MIKILNYIKEKKHEEILLFFAVIDYGGNDAGRLWKPEQRNHRGKTLRKRS